MSLSYPPRIMRPAEAAYYVGMSKDLFNREIRPLVPVISLGDRAIGFDRIDLDEAIYQYKESNTRNDESPWLKSQDSIGMKPRGKGSSINRSEDSDFLNASKQVRESRQRRSTTNS
jgi:hypothetical protein